MKENIFEKKFGAVTARYITDAESGVVGLCILPDADMPLKNRRAKVMPLAEVKIAGSVYSGSYLGGESMKLSPDSYTMQFDRREISDSAVVTYLKSENGIEIKHTLAHKEGRRYLTVRTELTNNSGNDIKLEMLSSFALCGISPYIEGAGENTMKLHRLRSKWSLEARLVTEPLEDLLLEDSWTMGHYKSVRFGQVGSMPAKNYIPFIAVEDTQNGLIWGARIGCPSSWQMEITRADDGVGISGGLADREFGHWMKTVKSGEAFTAPKAVISVCSGNIDDIAARLNEAQEDALDVPESEEGLPVIFNEYCTTWGNPSHDNIAAILDAIKGKGIDYFVIDCGWFKEDGVRWDISMGDYVPSATLFPDGIKATADLIRSRGMKAGIWFEIENAGERSRAYRNEEHLLKRDGVTLTTVNRRFWDMNDEWVQSYLTERVIDFMRENGFEYIKVDHNETIGIGADNSDSLGEGLRLNQLAGQEFFKKMKREIDGLVIENCASGGGRLEPSFMALSSMASFSDAHECVEIPIIAANLHRAILPRQSQIWCVIRKSDTVKRIAYSVSAAFLGRMCLSGDVNDLSDAQWDAIDRGIALYKKAAPVIKNGFTRIYRENVTSYRHPEGYQAVVRVNDNAALCVIHTFKNAPNTISVPVGDYDITDVYSDTDIKAEVKDGVLTVCPNGGFCGAGVLMKKKY